MNKKNYSKELMFSGLCLFAIIGCSDNNLSQEKEQTVAKVQANVDSSKNNETQLIDAQSDKGKPVVYQVFTRLFGNSNSTNKQWGTKEDNGVGKFNDFTDKALRGIKEFGVTHIWYTGVPHHALVGDYTQYGISLDDPDVIKGRAGSPYAVKDYYNVNPDLAVDPSQRLQEFKDLITRTHQHGMKVIIDIVPNHVARNYQSISKPNGVKDFGVDDDTSVEYKRDNNFYYVVGKPFQVPEPLNNYQPLGGEENPLADGKFEENPAKWTGNGARKAQPHFHDWYETVKVNYGVRPDGSYDFPRLPKDYASKNHQQHFQFWSDKDVPDSWQKFRDIVIYWTEMGVDGFRYDMAEMVPVEFWSYLNSAIKQKNSDAFLLAEVYNPKIYRDYIYLGKMDYLYDKVDLYDTLKLIMQGRNPTSDLIPIINRFTDIDTHLLHFLENHDEQRIASPDFAGNANKGKPAMVVSTLLGKGPTMLYFAQALGEAGEGDAGFGDPTRTSIFDYWGVDTLQRWNNGGEFDGGKLTVEEKSLREFYAKLLSYSSHNDVVNHHYADLHQVNVQAGSGYDEKIFSFTRWNEEQRIIVVSNFSDKDDYEFVLDIPGAVVSQWKIEDGKYSLRDLFTERDFSLNVKDGKGEVSLRLEPLLSLVLRF